MRKLAKKRVPKRDGPGRPPWEPSKEVLTSIERMRGLGMSPDAIAHVVGVDRRTLARKFPLTVKLGKEVLKGRIVSRLVEDALHTPGQPGITAAIATLKMQFGMTDRPEIREAVEDGAGMAIIVRGRRSDGSTREEPASTAPEAPKEGT